MGKFFQTTTKDFPLFVRLKSRRSELDQFSLMFVQHVFVQHVFVQHVRGPVHAEVW